MQNRFNLWIDRWAIGLSGLCLLHCLLTTAAIAMLSAGGASFFTHDIHKTGLAIAIPLAVLGLGRGMLRHRRWQVVAIGGTGIGLMALALGMDHGTSEFMLTVIGAVLVAVAHWFNIRLLHA